MTVSVLTAVSTTLGTGPPRRPAAARNDASQAGSNCSAMVELALTRSRLRRSARKAAIPASSPAATSSSRAAHSAITVPSAVRLEPRGVRCTSATPVCASIAAIRADTACWLTPACRAALFRLPVWATASSTSSAARSGTCWLSAIRSPHQIQATLVSCQARDNYCTLPAACQGRNMTTSTGALAGMNTAAAQPRAQVRAALADSCLLALSCLISYWLATTILALAHSPSQADDLLGGMWAVIATVFVLRHSYSQSMAAALSRMAATLVSFVLCLAYLAFLPFHPWALAGLIGLSALAVTLLGRPGDAVTAAITTAVVMVAAELAPHDAWQQPILRLADTVIGVAVGIAAAWIGLRVLRRQLGSFHRKINGDAGARANSQAGRDQVVNPLALTRPGPADVPANLKQA